MVIAFHYCSYFSPQIRPLGSLWKALFELSSVGWAGVDIFFVLSGFLITRTVMVRRVDSVLSYLLFVKRRAARLLPAYVMCIAIVTVVALIIDPHSKVLKNEYLLWSLSSNVQTLYGDRMALGDENFAMFHFWSLALEWHFYLLFPIVVFLTKSVIKTSVMLICMALLCRCLFHVLDLSDNAIYSFTICRMDSLAIGCIIASANFTLARKHSAVCFASGVALLVLLLLPTALSTTPFKLLTWMQIFGYTGIALAASLIVTGVTNCDNSSAIKRILESTPLRAIGRASYSLYIWHLPFFPLIVSVSRSVSSDPRFQFATASTLGIAATCVFGGLSYRLIESPSGRIQRRSTV